MALVRFSNNKNQGVNQWVNDFFAPLAHDSFYADRTISRVPAVNISESPTAYHIELAAPGVDKGDFNVQVEGDVLTISAERKGSSTTEDKKFSKREFSYSSFTRSFTLPDNAQQSQITGKYQDGVLFVTVAKKEEAKPVSQQIDIQ